MKRKSDTRRLKKESPPDDQVIETGGIYNYYGFFQFAKKVLFKGVKQTSKTSTSNIDKEYQIGNVLWMNGVDPEQGFVEFCDFSEHTKTNLNLSVDSVWQCLDGGYLVPVRYDDVASIVDSYFQSWEDEEIKE